MPPRSPRPIRFYPPVGENIEHGTWLLTVAIASRGTLPKTSVFTLGLKSGLITNTSDI